MFITTADLIADIKNRAFMPATQSTFEDSDLLDIANGEMHTIIVPMILSTMEHYLVTSEDKTVTASSRSFRINPRAIASGLSDVTFVDGSVERSIPRIDDRASTRTGFRITGNKITFTGSETGTARLYFNLRPGNMIETTSAAKITAFDTTARTVTVDSAPSGFIVGDYDIHWPSGFEYTGFDLAVSGVAANVLTFSSDLPSDIAIDQWVSLAGYTPVVEIPLEIHPYLAQLVATQVLESIGDHDSMTASQNKLRTYQENALSMLNPRVDGEARRLVPPRNRR